jgi:hypothetical protein
MDLLEKKLEALMLCDPRAHLREQVFGDVDGAGLAVLLERRFPRGLNW